jgi:hypothetical protein
MVPGSENILPPDLDAILKQIEIADRAADTLASRLTDEQLFWQPDGGRSWSVAQCLEHIATINVLYGDAVRGAVDRARRAGWTRKGPLAPGFFGRKFIASQEPPVTRRVSAPARVRPGTRLTRTEILRRYHEAHERVKETIRAAAKIDANRATFPNPFLKLVRVKVATGLHVIPAHDRRHLWQAQQVTERPDFPPGPPTTGR